MTLIEMLAVIVLSTLVLGVVVTLLAGLGRFDRSLREGWVRNAQVDRLSETLRADIRRAADVTLAADGTLVVTEPGGDVLTRYELVPEGCLRTIEVASQRESIDLFTVGRAESWSLDVGPAGRRPMLVITLQRSDDPEGRQASFMPLFMCAALGADTPAAHSATGATATTTP